MHVDSLFSHNSLMTKYANGALQPFVEEACDHLHTLLHTPATSELVQNIASHDCFEAESFCC